MSYTWSIQKAAIEQQVLFPTERCFEAYIETLSRKEEPFEIVRKEPQTDGSLLIVIRKRYNNNEFFKAGE